MSVASALESSATQFDHESVTASCCDAVSLSHTSVPKVSPVKPKVASPRPKRWAKHSTTTVTKSPQGGGENGHGLNVYLHLKPSSCLHFITHHCWLGIVSYSDPSSSMYIAPSFPTHDTKSKGWSLQ